MRSCDYSNIYTRGRLNFYVEISICKMDTIGNFRALSSKIFDIQKMREEEDREKKKMEGYRKIYELDQRNQSYEKKSEIECISTSRCTDD